MNVGALRYKLLTWDRPPGPDNSRFIIVVRYLCRFQGPNERGHEYTNRLQYVYSPSVSTALQ